MRRKIKIKFTDFECNLLINGMNEFRNMLASVFLCIKKGAVKKQL